MPEFEVEVQVTFKVPVAAANVASAMYFAERTIEYASDRKRPVMIREASVKALGAAEVQA